MILDDPTHPGSAFDTPVFVDSENLVDLSLLRQHILKSDNLVLLLTPGLLSRPWCLVEIQIAISNGINIIPVELDRPGASFEYPKEDFYQNLQQGNYLSAASWRVIAKENISPDDVEKAIRKVFEQIALPFSPHRSSAVRDAELRDILGDASLIDFASLIYEAGI
eukprot:CAMPEP_0170648108 /NCGR_PEP_ID=MMETSP0224-20130122/44562_1 /TAXON_ID=285029 /ORGANISM="Togula jolla, Strain CCCM 725" /LENGTH=164 /DNA_ID=CAMNT_0010979619 /DNA_START=9 /DNA_END=501 /DNA_ORIENTATION=+